MIIPVTAESVASPVGRNPRRRITGTLAALWGVLGAVLAVAVPFLPIEVDDVTLTWPQGGSGSSVTAPLVAYAPVDIRASIPCSVASRVVNGGDAVIASTIPPSSPKAQTAGLLVVTRAASNGEAARLLITLRNVAVLDIPLSRLTTPDCVIRLASSATETTTTIDGVPGVTPLHLTGDYRPQMVGIFSYLNASEASSLTIAARIDNRFDSTPTLIKLLAAVLAFLATLLSLTLVARMDGYAPRLRVRPDRRLLRPSAPDVVVVSALLLWHVIGANTADDGYQLGMARASTDAGYMVNYFRYFGVPETPFGTPYYDLLAVLTHVCTASVWMRLPALVLALATWWLIRTKVLLRLGVATRASRLPAWGAALVFLAFWLPYNNGLRPEPVVAFGVLLTWWACEHAIATRRLLPLAAAVLTAAFTLTAGPSGLICVAALIASSRPISAIIRSEVRARGRLAVVGPLLSCGLIVLVAVFADQSIGAVPAMIDAHDAAGPSLPWFEEYLRYQYLLQDTVDGSPARRFGVLVMIAAVSTATAVLLRRHGIPGLAAGPTRRLLGVSAGALVLMMFTPTKWTHHFGVFAGLAASVAAVLVVVIGPAVLRSRRNRALVTAVTALLMALVLTSRNGYWYVSSWGVPWFDKAPSVHGFGVATVFRGITVIALVAALWFHINDRAGSTPAASAVPSSRWRRASPVVLAAAFMVIMEVASLASAAVAQYPAYSIARSNIDAVLGRPCGLANDVLVEIDPNASLLQPVGAPPGDALKAGGATGFIPNGVAADLSADEDGGTAGTANSVAAAAVGAPGTGGGQSVPGSNGSTAALPFGLDPRTAPVLGSFAATGPASVTTAWYRLPERDSTGYRGDLVAITAAGRIRSVDRDGTVTYGQGLYLELGSTTSYGAVVTRGTRTPIDIGPAPSWRNLRIPMPDIPSDIDAVRIVATDTDLDTNQWLAITPPRVPRTTVLNTLVGSSAPVMIDWAVGLNFPCQHPLTLRDGVMQIPQYRILPDRRGAEATNLWQDAFGGGPLGWIEAVLTAETLPSYLRGDLYRDWGELEQYHPRAANSEVAQLQTRHIERSGLWSPGPIKTG